MEACGYLCIGRRTGENSLGQPDSGLEGNRTREEGYEIDSVTNKGYRLSSASDVLREEDIRKYLAVDGLEVRVYRSITSTNTVLKTMAEEGAPEGRCLIAGEQTAGRGRRGRNFYSPPDSHEHHGLCRSGGGRGDREPCPGECGNQVGQ